MATAIESDPTLARRHHPWALAFHAVNDQQTGHEPIAHGREAQPNELKPRFRYDIQGLRTIAVVLVVVFHSGVGLPGGFLGVDVFFVISGFVIGRLLFHEHESTGRIALGRFYARRVRRLLPALSAMLVFVAIVSVFGASPIGTLQSTIAKVGAGAALYVANFAMLIFQKNGYFALSETTNPLLHTWTLGVEEQFYLFFPLLLVCLGFVWRRRPTIRRAVVIVGVGLVALVSFVLGAAMNGTLVLPFVKVPVVGRAAFYSSPTRAWEFLIGVVAALIEPRLMNAAERFPRSFGALGIVGAGAIVWSGLFLDAQTATPGPTTLIPVLGAFSVIVGGVAGRNATSRMLSTPVAVWIGDRSYGWYLWHWPLIVFARTSFPTAPSGVLLAVAVAALIPTALSYRFIEQPTRKGSRWSGRRVVMLGLGCTAVALVFMAGLAAFPDIHSAGQAAVERSLERQGPQPKGCLVVQHDDDPRTEYHCDWSVPRPRGSIVLVGDSQAGMFADVLAKEATQAGYALNISYRPSCPFADVRRGGLDSTVNCRAYYKRTMTALEITHPDLVVVASLQDAYVRQDGSTMTDPVTGKQAHTVAERAEIWRDGLTRTLKSLTHSGMRVAVISTIPQLSPFNISECPAWRLWIEPTSCNRTLSRKRVEAFRAPGWEATSQAVASVPNTHLVDFIDGLCSSVSCSTLRGDTWLYANSAHLSAAGAMALDRQFAQEVVPLAGRSTQ